MTKHELVALEAELNNEFGNRLRLGGYNADANHITYLTKVALIFARHLIQLDKEITKLKRATPDSKRKR